MIIGDALIAWWEFTVMMRKRLEDVSDVPFPHDDDDDQCVWKSDWRCLVYCFKIQSFNWTCSSSHPSYLTTLDCNVVHCGAVQVLNVSNCAMYFGTRLFSCINKDSSKWTRTWISDQRTRGGCSRSKMIKTTDHTRLQCSALCYFGTQWFTNPLALISVHVNKGIPSPRIHVWREPQVDVKKGEWWKYKIWLLNNAIAYTQKQ